MPGNLLFTFRRKASGIGLSGSKTLARSKCDCALRKRAGLNCETKARLTCKSRTKKNQSHTVTSAGRYTWILDRRRYVEVGCLGTVRMEDN
jgi:hypothetical protein